MPRGSRIHFLRFLIYVPPYSGDITNKDNRDYDRFIVVRGSDRTLCFFDGDDGNGNNRYRSTGYEINPLNFSGWNHFAALASGSRTSFFINGKFVGDADRREQSTIKYIGNSSSNELFAEYLDDVRIYGVSLEFSEVSDIYGDGFGDQYPTFMLSEITDADSDPRIIEALVGKDGSDNSSKWNGVIRLESSSPEAYWN